MASRWSAARKAHGRTPSTVMASLLSVHATICTAGRPLRVSPSPTSLAAVCALSIEMFLARLSFFFNSILRGRRGAQTPFFLLLGLPAQAKCMASKKKNQCRHRPSDFLDTHRALATLYFVSVFGGAATRRHWSTPTKCGAWAPRPNPCAPTGHRRLQHIACPKNKIKCAKNKGTNPEKGRLPNSRFYVFQTRKSLPAAGGSIAHAGDLFAILCIPFSAWLGPSNPAEAKQGAIGAHFFYFLTKRQNMGRGRPSPKEQPTQAKAT